LLGGAKDDDRRAQERRHDDRGRPYNDRDRRDNRRY
jgi:hypothetical protein